MAKGSKNEIKNCAKSDNAEFGWEFADGFELVLFIGGESQDVVVYVPVEVSAFDHFVPLLLSIDHN